MSKQSLQKELYTKLVEFYMKKTGLSKDIAVSQLYRSKTMQCLIDEKTEFYAKHINEIKYLLELEMQGKNDEWHRQAII